MCSRIEASIDAVEESLQIKNGSLSVIELVESAIKKIEELNPTLNAVVTKTYEQARETAKQQLPDSPLSGIPILIKNLTSIKGVRLTYGSLLFKDYIPNFDSEIVKRMKNAGMIILGVTNTPEFGLTSTTEPKLHGPTRNPWNTDYSSGGSSGGSAAAVASGMVSIAHGSDGGGSIRLSSSFCGVFGLKPTRGRVPHSPVSGSAIIGLSVNHALTRSVRDSAAFLDIIDGYCVGEPYWSPPKHRPYIEEIGANPGKLRMALVTKTTENDDFHPDVEKEVRKSVKLCSELGHVVEEVDVNDIFGMDPQQMLDAFLNIWCTLSGSVLHRASMRAGVPPQREWVEDLTWGLYLRSKGLSATDYMLSHTVLEQFGRNLNRFLTGYDVILTATTPDPPFKLGAVNPTYEEPMKNFEKAIRTANMTAMSNAAGNPAMSVPLGKSRKGLPIGTQFIGRFGDEALLFRLASQLEKVKPWKTLHN
ncbi:MAG: amidase [Candidatus Bathyarchaeota archaeon]|nr:amidase [Candidatus Bathyarchaeota archaeon]